MKTIVTIEIEHAKPLAHLGDMIAGRAWTIDGVRNAEVVECRSPDELSAAELRAIGFTDREISLGAQEAARA